MKKLVTTTFTLIIFSVNAYAQTFLVSKVVGTISNDKKLVASGDNIKGLDKLSATTANAAMRVVSPKTGSIVICFSHGKKIIKDEKDEKSELYELIVQEYVDKYTTAASTQTKPGPSPKFDWIGFFYAYPKEQMNHRMLIVEGEKIPLESEKFNPTTSFEVFASTYNTKTDSTSQKFPKLSDSLRFTPAVFPLKGTFNLDIYIGYHDKLGNWRMPKVTDQPIQASYMTTQQFNDLIHFYYDDWQKNYKSVDAAKEELYFYLKINYDRFYDPYITRMIEQVFK